MVRVRSWVPVLVVVMVGSGGLVGCSGGAGAGASPSVDPYEVGASAMAVAASASASARASRDAALGPDLAARREAALATPPPERPEQISENTTEGAATAAAYFIDLYQYAFVTGDTKDFEAMSEQRCVFCNNVVSNVKKIHDSGGWADPWDSTVTAVRVYEQNPGYDYIHVEIDMQWAEGTSYDGDGTPKTTDSGDFTLIIAMRYVNGSWVVGESEVKK